MPEEYEKSTNKLEYYQSLSFEEQKNLLFTILKSDRMNILQRLALEEIVKLLKEYQPLSSERNQILECLTEDQLIAIYKSASKDEKIELGKEIEKLQLSNKIKLEELESSLVSSSNNIESSINRIVEANSNISNNKNQIKNNKRNIRANKVKLKLASARRNLLLKRLERLSTKETSKIGIINKIRERRLESLTEKYNNQEININNLREDNQRLAEDINKANAEIEREKQTIEDSRKAIKEEQEKMKQTSKMIKGHRTKIRKLDKAERKMFGKKLYNKVINTRDERIAIIKKHRQSLNNAPTQQQVEQPQQVEQQPQQVEQQPQQVEQQPQQVEQQQVEQQPQQGEQQPQQVEQDKKTEKQNIQNITQLFGLLLSNGMIPLPNVRLEDSNNRELLNDSQVNIDREQLVTIIYGMRYAYNLGLQQARQQAIAEGRVDESGKIISNEQLQQYREMGNVRTLRKRGIVSFPTLMFISALIITIISIILLINR